MNTIQSLKELYVKMGGSLTDTYSGIASGIPVSDYTVIPDMIKALYAIYDGDLTEVYPEISDVAVSDYSTTPKAIEALAEVATKGIVVNESYDISEGTLNGATITLEGDVTAHIPDGVTTIGAGAFAKNQIIKSVIIPYGVTTIENGEPWKETETGAFSYCTSLTSITIPDSVTSIGGGAFYNCTGLTSIVIPDSVTSIGKSTFYNCEALTDIYYTGTQAEWEAITGISDAEIPEGATIHYEYTPE